MRMKRFLIGALVAGSLLGSAVGVSAAAEPNNSFANCHGVIVSQTTAEFGSVGQFHKATGEPVGPIMQGIQAFCKSI